MKQYNLKASGKSFEAIDVPSECYIEFDDLLSSKPLNSFEGILIVKNVFSHEIIDSLRSQYFSMFGGDYEYDGSEWTHVESLELLFHILPKYWCRLSRQCQNSISSYLSQFIHDGNLTVIYLLHTVSKHSSHKINLPYKFIAMFNG